MNSARIQLLEEIQINRAWEAVEDYLKEYITNHLRLEETVKRNDEFNTVWDRAFTEGGKFHLIQFFNNLEEEVRNNKI